MECAVHSEARIVEKAAREEEGGRRRHRSAVHSMLARGHDE